MTPQSSTITRHQLFFGLECFAQPNKTAIKLRKYEKINNWKMQLLCVVEIMQSNVLNEFKAMSRVCSKREQICAV